MPRKWTFLPWTPARQGDKKPAQMTDVNAPMLLGVLCYFGAFLCIGISFSTGKAYLSGRFEGKPWITPEQVHAETRSSLSTTIPLSVLLLAGGIFCTRWWLRRVRPNDVIDVLGELFPQESIFSAGRVHLAALGFQGGAFYRVVIAVQNLFDAPTRVDLEFNTTGPDRLLQVDLGPLEVSLAVIDLQVDIPPGGIVLNLGYDIQTTGTGGRQMRNIQRSKLSPRKYDLSMTEKRSAADPQTLQYWTGKTHSEDFQFFTDDSSLSVALDEHNSSQICNYAGRWFLMCLWNKEDLPWKIDPVPDFLDVLSATSDDRGSVVARSADAARLRAGLEPATSGASFAVGMSSQAEPLRMSRRADELPPRPVPKAPLTLRQRILIAIFAYPVGGLIGYYGVKYIREWLFS